ncbi:MAG: leucine-rich repeat domain-containing protein [Lachnospiraceae bacterium]|nr:leucine-rich repeat domain-containing protein [Lachnospiraceae bacterium]
MKKIATFGMAVLLILSLAGCGEATKDVTTTETVENSTTENAEPEYCGTWNIDHIVIDGTKYVQSELEAMDDYRGRSVLVIKEGGNAYVAEGGVDGVIVEWSETDVGILLDGEDMVFVDGLLRLKLYDEVWYFKRTSDSQLIEKPVDTETQETVTEEAEETEQTESETTFLADAEPVNDEVYVSGNFEFVHYTDGSIEIKKYKGSDTSVDISTEIAGYPVSRIGSGAFENCSTVESIYLWADIISIGEAAFRNCSKLDSFDIPSTVTTIEASTFENCTDLEDIYIWGDITDIGDSAFKNCESLKSIDIPSNCTSIGASAFEGCTGLETVYYWGKRIECGVNAFANCPKLKDMPEEIIYAKGESVPKESSSETADNVATTLVEGMRLEFKEAMDTYEAFYSEYCDFMKDYKKNPTDPALLAKYSELLTKAVDVEEAFEAWGEDELNNEELKYYIEVNSRVMQKMVEVTG